MDTGGPLQSAMIDLRKVRRDLSESSTNPNRAIWFAVYSGGAISTLVIYGILQERIMTVPYGGELFTVSAFLVLSNRIFNAMFAASMIKVNGEPMANTAPMWKYIAISLANVIATCCQYECLKHLSFPVQMLGKSFKMMPVMMWGIAISGKAYGFADWAVALCVTLGVAEFCLLGPMTAPNDHASSLIGFALLLTFLAFDGLTATLQEKMFKEHTVSKFNQMFYVNAGSVVVSFLTIVGMGELSNCLAFCARHLDFVASVSVLSVAAAGSQYFIYSEVKEFGALVFAATMNVRQVVSILVSGAIYHHAMTWLQYLGLFVVFTALFSKSYVGLMGSNADSKEKDHLLSVNNGVRWGVESPPETKATP